MIRERGILIQAVRRVKSCHTVPPLEGGELVFVNDIIDSKA